MADNVQLNSGSGGETCATDDIGGIQFQRVKLTLGADGTNDGDVASGNPLPVSDAGGSLTVDGTVAVSGTVTVDGSGVTQPVSHAALSVTGGGAEASALRVTLANDSTGVVSVDDNGATISVDDGGSSLTIDNAALSVTGGGVEASALRVTIANDSTGVVSVDDNGSSLTVDGTVAATQSGTWNVTNISGTVSLPTGAATAAKQPALGTAGTPSADVISVQGVSGGTALPVSDGGSTLTVDGTVAATQSGTWSARLQDGSGTALTSKTAGSEQAISVAIVDGSGNQVTSFGGSGGTSATDDAAFTPASGSGTPIMGFADETSPDAVDEGDVGVVRMTLQRALHVNLRDASGAELSVGGGTQYTEDAAAAANPVGTALNLIRADSLAGVTSADGDNVAARGTDKGELYVKHVDAIPVTDNGGALTVDGTVAVSGTVTVDGSGSTQPVSNAGLTALNGAIAGTEVQVDVVGALPAGTNNIGDVDIASIAAGDNNIGNVDVASLPTELHSADFDSGAGTATRHAVGLIVPASGGAAVITGDASNGLDVDVTRVSGTVTVDGSGVTQPVSNAGTFAVQESGSALTALQLIDDPVFADDAAFTPGTSKVNVSGFIADEASTDSVDEGDAGAARMTLDRRQITVPQPHSAGGLSIFRSLDLDETEEDVKTSPGCVYAVWITNQATSVRWIKFYNATAANVTVGSTTPVITFGIPGNSTDKISANLGPGGMGIQFDTAICVAATTGVADADTGAPSANDVVINVFYR